MVRPTSPKIKPIAKMLEDPKKELNKTFGPVGALSKLFRVILFELKVSPYRFSMLMDRFLNDPKNQVPDNPKERFNNRGNLNKEFSNPAMSWKVFIKCMKFLQFTELRLTLEARHNDGTITSHRAMIDLRDGSLKDIPLFEEEMAQDPNQKLRVPDDQETFPFLDNDEEEE